MGAQPVGKVLFLAAAAGAALAPWFVDAALAEERKAPLQYAREFQVLRQNSPIGHHRVEVTAAENETRVKVDIGLEVRLAGLITVFRYKHEAEEIWRNGRLVSIKSNTYDDGEKLFLEAEAVPGGPLRVRGSKFEGFVPAEIMPTSYWNREFPKHQTLLDTQSGKLLNVNVQEESQALASDDRDSVPGHRYRLDGDLRLRLGYDAEGRWNRMAFKASDGSEIEYRLKD